MMADAHHRLRQDSATSNLEPTDSDEDLAITDVWAYGTSTLNVRIESWWGQLAGSETNRWRVSTSCIVVFSHSPSGPNKTDQLILEMN